MSRGSRPQPGQLALFEEMADGPPAVLAPALTATSTDDSNAVSESPAPTAEARRLRSGVPAPRRGMPAERAAFRPAVAVLPSPAVTLDQAIPAYLTALAALGRSQHTLKSFELDLRLLRGQLGNRAVGSIELGHLRQFIAWVRLSRENSPNSLRRKVATLKNFFGYL